jgi:hypothetical protein
MIESGGDATGVVALLDASEARNEIARQELIS